MRIASARFASILIGSTVLLSACSKRISTQGAAKPLEFFDETSRDTLRSAPLEDTSDDCTSEIRENSSSSITRSINKRSIRSQMHEHQARLVDIPVPLQSTPLERYFYAQEGAVTLGYDVRGYVSDYMIFYEQGLERSGWQKVALSATPFETLLVYDKPERFCVVSLRHARSDGVVPILIVIHTGTKEISV